MLIPHFVSESFLKLPKQNLRLSPGTVMGVLNVGNESFCPIGRHPQLSNAISYAQELVTAGAAIIDVGGEPTHPGVQELTLNTQQELDRVIPVIEALTQAIDTPISIDTSDPIVMREAVAAGASIINDVRALRREGALTMAAKLAVPVCLMHMHAIDNKPVVASQHSGEALFQIIYNFFQERIQACLAAGIEQSSIIIDPGFGGGRFGKNTKQNLYLMRNLNRFTQLGKPLLIGVSRKIFIGEVLGANVSDRLYGSLGLAIIAMLQGAQIIRVHDVKATKDVIKIINACLYDEYS